MIFKFGICNWDGCEEEIFFFFFYNSTREEIIEKIHKAFRNQIKDVLDEDNKRPLRKKVYCTEKEPIGILEHSRKLREEFEKVGLKKVKIPTYVMFAGDDAYDTLGMEAKCRGVENCQKEWCDKVDWWQEEMKERKRKREEQKIFDEEIL